MVDKKGPGGKKPPPPPQEGGAEGGGTAASRLRSLIIAELSQRLADPLFGDLVLRGGIATPGGPDCGDCKGNCHGQCETSCRGDCTGTCGNNCSGQCTGDCKNTACKGDCALSAKADRGPSIPLPDDMIGRYILTVIGPTIEAVKLALLKEGFPR